MLKLDLLEELLKKLIAIRKAIAPSQPFPEGEGT